MKYRYSIFLRIISYRNSIVNRISIFFCYNFFMNSLGERIKELRHESRLTQRELAQALSITVPTLSHWECNYQEPSYKDILRICNYFDVSMDYLAGRTDELGAVLPSSSKSTLSDREEELLGMFRQMNIAQQNRFLGIAEGMIEEAKKFKTP